MRTSKIWLLIASCVASYATPLLVGAQQSPQQPPPQTPPKLEKLEEGEPPTITIRKPEGGPKVLEKRQGGKVDQIVVDTGVSTYYLKPVNQPGDQPGTAVPGDAQGMLTRPPLFPVLEFDFGLPKEAKEVPTPQTLPPAQQKTATPSSPAKK